MLVFSAQSLAYLAVPKTGTTAVEMALRSKADIVFARRRKHMTAQQFQRKVAPFLKRAFDLIPDRVAVMRDPEEQIRSWYRYRAREEQRGAEVSTKGIGFDAFVLDVISDSPPPHARIGSQFRMLTGATDQLLVHHLFDHAAPDLFVGFLSDRFEQKITLSRKNASPAVPAALDPATRRKLRQARAAEFDLYDRIRDAGGQLSQTLD